jgi:hypothetical protein
LCSCSGWKSEMLRLRLWCLPVFCLFSWFPAVFIAIEVSTAVETKLP